MWTCCTYLQAQGGGSLDPTLMATELSALSRSKSIPEKYYWPGSLTDHYLVSLFGTTLPRSEATTQTQPITSPDCAHTKTCASRAGSHAKTLAPLEKAQESQESVAGYGLSFPASSARYDRDTSSWRIHPCLFPEDSMSCLVTLPKWGTMRSGELSERTTPEEVTNGIGSGSWPTPMCDGGFKSEGQVDKLAQNNITFGEFRGMCYRASETHKKAAWPTPCARDWKDTRGMAHSATNPDGTHRDRTDLLPTRIYSQTSKEVSGTLNPDWVEWLMGWPVGWTQLEPLPVADYPAVGQWSEDPAILGALDRVTPPQPARRPRLKCIGNGQVPAAASLAWNVLNRMAMESAP